MSEEAISDPEITADNQEEQQDQEEIKEDIKEDSKAAALDDAPDSNQPSDQPDFTSENKENLLESDEPKSKLAEDKKQKRWENSDVKVLSFDRKADDVYYEIELTNQTTRETTFVFRGYKDIQWLYRFCDQKTNIGGHVLHPLPTLPYVLPPPMMELNLDCHAIYGDVNKKACKSIESFLRFLVLSDFFGVLPEVHSFFSNDEVPQHEALSDGNLLSVFTRAYSNYQYSQLADPEDAFTEAFDHVEHKIPLIQSTCEAYERNVSCQQNLALGMVDVLSSLDEVSSYEADHSNKESSQCLSRLRDGLDYYKQCRFDVAVDEHSTVSFTLDLFHHYHRQYKAMLLRRLKSLQQLQVCRTQLEKATKPLKKEAADAAHKIADAEYEEITDSAKQDMSAFKSRYALSIQQALQDCCEASISHYTKTAKCLASLLEEMKN